MGRQHSGGPPFISRGGALSWTAECRVGGCGVENKNSQFESDALHFNQKSSMSLSYLALETGQSRAAVSCFNTLLAGAALQISRPLFSSFPPSLSNILFSRLQLRRESLRERRRGQNVYVGRETAAGMAAVPAQSHSLPLLRAQRTGIRVF